MERLTSCRQKHLLFQVRTTFQEICIYQIIAGPLNPNSTDPRISGNVEILEEVGKGRTAFARTSIPIGSIVAMDKGEGTHLNPENPQRSLQYCLECLGSVSVAFPCSGCPRVVFCSRECGEAAEASHHRIPCAIDLQSLRGIDNKDGMTIFTCLRLLLQHPATFWLEHQAQLLLPSPDSEWPTPNKTDLERMKNVFYMVVLLLPLKIFNFHVFISGNKCQLGRERNRHPTHAGHRPATPVIHTIRQKNHHI